MTVMAGVEAFTPEEFVITEPGVYLMPPEVYHADPVPGGSLSATGMKRLLPPSCPAKFKWLLDNPEPPKTTFDLGHAAHRMVLSEGEVLEVIDAPDWKTKAAREARDAARAEGKVPLLAHQLATVEAMAAEIRRHPIAGALFRPGEGDAEQSLFWKDKATGQQCRARVDWLPKVHNGRLIAAEYKSAADAEPFDTLPRTFARLGYHVQAAHYLEGIKVLGLGGERESGFVFVVQEKEAPYVVSVVELDYTAIAIGRALRRRAIDIYRRCLETDHWGGYDDDVVLLQLPHYVVNEFDEQELANA